jgi:hypothetical protein
MSQPAEYEDIRRLAITHEPKRKKANSLERSDIRKLKAAIIKRLP